MVARWLNQIIVVTVVRAETVKTFGPEHWEPMKTVITNESGFNPYAVNSSSGACGLGQSLPCSKVLNKCRSLKNVKCQAEWIVEYIASRYFNPQNALNFWNQHNWY